MVFTLGPRATSQGYRIAAFDKTGSTNVEAMAGAREGERGPMWFVTTEQTAGRGRRSRPWIAPRGNLASSILEVMDVAPAVAATLGSAAGLAAGTALRQVSTEAARRAAVLNQPNYSLKWPNDVLADGKKIVGILLEAETVPGDLLAVVVGIGTNVVAAPEAMPTPATSLKAFGLDTSAEELFTALSDSWAECRAIWDQGRGFGEIRRRWLALATGLGQPVAVYTGTATLTGIFDTIDDTGCMIVRTSAGEKVPVSAGDVHFGVAASAGAR